MSDHGFTRVSPGDRISNQAREQAIERVLLLLNSLLANPEISGQMPYTLSLQLRADLATIKKAHEEPKVTILLPS